MKPSRGAAKNVAGDALSFVRLTRKELERAIVQTQKALAEAETDQGCDPKHIERIARTLREALTNLACLPTEIESAVLFAGANGVTARRYTPPVNGRGGEA